MHNARLAVFVSALLFAFASARQTRHHLKRDYVSIINPSNALFTCQNYTMRWNGTGSPYSVGVLVGTEVTAPLYHLGASATNSYTWNVDLPPNTTVTFAVKARSGDVGYSSKVVIQPSNFIGCLYNSPWRVQGTNFTYPTNPNATYTGPYSNGTYVNGTFTNTTDGIGGAGAAAPTQRSGNGASRTAAGTAALLFAAALSIALA